MIPTTEMNRLLEATIASLDLSDEMAEEAIAEYGVVAEWLNEEGSALHGYSPEVYPQGSFRLGTPVRPLRASDEFDIDLVCRLSVARERTTQAQLKDSVGDRLKLHKELSSILQAKRRCWTLTYPNRFHLDVLPAIPDEDAGGDCILLTDTELTRWQHSNPVGYATWFFDRMQPVFSRLRLAKAAAAAVRVEDVPEWTIRTPLQRSVQMLKRHRDLRFAQAADDRPTSIILTTLAARAYGQQTGLYDALIAIVDGMPAHVECRNGVWWVPNPAQPQENFADKWNETPARRVAFIDWLAALRRDIGEITEARDSAGALALVQRKLRPGPARVSAGVPALADWRHAQTLPWPELRLYGCTVAGSVHMRAKGRRLHALAEQGSVPKKVDLRFEAETDAPRPYEVQWQVVNTGREAASVPRGPRGEFYQSEPPDSRVRWETTAYAGTHWVEALIVKDARCVARSGRKYVKIRG